MNDNTMELIKWHKDQLAKLLSDGDDFYKAELELDVILEKIKTKKKVQVRRGGTTFWREQEVGKKGNGDVKGSDGNSADKMKKLQQTFDNIKNIDLKDLRDEDSIVRAMEILSELKHEMEELKMSSKTTSGEK